MKCLVAILLLFCTAGVNAGEHKILQQDRVLPIPQSENMRWFFLEELGVMKLRGAESGDAEGGQSIEGAFDGNGWTFRLFGAGRTRAEVVRIALPNEYRERFRGTNTHVDLAWEFESLARLESDGRVVPATLLLTGCGRCVSPEELSRWVLLIQPGEGGAKYEATGEVERDSPRGKD